MNKNGAFNDLKDHGVPESDPDIKYLFIGCKNQISICK